MTDTQPGHIEECLRQGKADQALQTARKYCEVAGANRDTGIAIAKATASVYRDLIAPPVIEFVEAAKTDLPSEVGLLVAKAMERLYTINADWEKRLWEVHVERLVREMRDWTRMRHIDAAADNVARLMALAPDTGRNQRAAYIGNTLATILNNQKEARDVVTLIAKKPQKYMIIQDEINVMEGSREKRYREIGSMNLDNIERQFSETLSEVTVEIKNVLPGQNAMGDPDEAVLRDVGDVFKSILRTPIFREEPDLLVDATNIFVEFVPKEQSATAKVARIEGRAYATLGFQAKKTVMLIFQDIGRNHFFTSVYRQWAKEYVATDHLGSIIEFMGALRTNDFNDFLSTVRSDRHISEKMSAKLNTAFGAIAGEAATETLMAELRSILGKKRLETPQLREAMQVITNLSVVVKSPRTSDQERSQIREFLKSHVPDDILKLARHTALQAFIYKPEDQTAQQRQWAVRVLTRSLWAPDETTAHQSGEGVRSPLGDRQEVVDALIKIGPHDIKTLTSTVDPLTARYGVAFIAAAEVFEKLADQSTLQTLDRMLNTTLIHDDNAKNVYQQEFYWDPTTQQRKPLTKDKVIGPIVFAIGTVGGQRSRDILRRYQEQIATGRVGPPTGEVASYLDRFLGAQGTESSGSGEHVEGILATGSRDTKQLMKQVKSNYFLSGKQKRRAKKVEGLTQLAQYTPEEALELVFKQLADKDALVVSAAITCLAEYAHHNKPKPLRDLAVNMCLDTLNSKDPAMRQGAIKLLREIGPNRKDVKPKVVAFAKIVERREVKEALAQAIKTGSGGSDPLEQMEEFAAAGGVSGEGGDSGKGMPSAMSNLELKRQYMQSRKAWIDGGKQGDPPPKPPGID